MFGVLRVVAAPRQRRVFRPFGKKRWLAMEGRRYGLSLCVIATVTLPQGLSLERENRRIGYALEQLHKQGVRRMVAPPLYRPLLEACGLAPVHPRPALHACIPQAVAAFARMQGLELSRIGLNIRGKRINRDIAAGVLALAARVRTVHLSLEQRDLGLENRLLEEFGIAARGAMPRDAQAVTLLLEGEAPGEADMSLTGEDIPGGPLPHLLCQDAKTPEGVDSNAFYTALYLDGGVASEALDIAWNPSL